MSGPMPREELIQLIYRIADEHAIPCVALLTLCLAESNLKSDAENLADGQYGSFGVAQQLADYAPERALPEFGAGKPLTKKQVEALKQRYFDPRHALEVAIPRLAEKLAMADGDVVDACCLYNGGSDPSANVNRWLYALSYTNAQKYISEGTPMAEFKLGFKALADRLGPDVVGTAIEDETFLTMDSGQQYSLQVTSKGLMIWSKQGNRAHFLPAKLS